MLDRRREQGQSGRSLSGLGVGTKLRIAFFCLSAFAVAAAVVGVLALSNIDERQKSVTDEALPAVIDAQKFAELTAYLVAEPLALSGARSLADLDQEVSVLTSRSDAVFSALDRFERSQFAKNHFTAIRPPLEQLLGSLSRQAELRRQQLDHESRQAATVASAKELTVQIIETIKPLVVDAYTDLLDTSDRIRAALSGRNQVDDATTLEQFDELTEVEIHRTERLAELSFRAKSLNSVIDRAALEINPDAIRILNRDFNSDLESLTRLARELPPSERRDQIGAYANALQRVGEGQESLFAIRLGHIATSIEIVELAQSTRASAETFSAGVANIVSEAQAEIETATSEARDSITFGESMLIIIAIGAFAVSIVIGWTFVSNHIVKRVNRLAAAMEELAAGNLNVFVSDQGTDELSEMADALAVFRENAIQIRQQETALKSSEERFSLAVQGASVGIWDWEDVNEDREYWSPMFYTLLGYQPGEIGSSLTGFKDLLHPDDRKPVTDAVDQHFSSGQPYDMEIRLRHKSGSYRWFHATGQASWNERGEPMRMTGSISDITERRKIARLLEIQAEDLRRSNAELEQFAYVTSHDLQEPLRMVASYCELLDRRYADRLDDDARDFIQFAVDGARRMQDLVRDILQLSRVGRVELKTTSTDLSALAREVVTDLSELVSDAGAEVRISDMPRLAVDAGLMRVVLRNLIQNGIKFRGDRRPVIEVSGKQVGEHYEISVADNGIGIDPQYAERIFQIFQRLHALSEYPGTGIGLALVKRIVERHGGEIWLDSAANHGSVFRFTIPYDIEDMETGALHDRIEHSIG